MWRYQTNWIVYIKLIYVYIIKLIYNIYVVLNYLFGRINIYFFRFITTTKFDHQKLEHNISKIWSLIGFS